jgi:ribosome biogenesis GTPase
MNDESRPEAAAPDSDTSPLATLGWSAALASAFIEHEALGRQPARVAAEHRGGYLVWDTRGESPAVVSGRFRHEASGAAEFPTVGDWVAVDRRSDGPAVVQAVLPRRTAFSRTASDSTRRDGSSDEQLLAANVDVAFIMAGLDREPNLRRLERYVALGWSSGAEPVILLSKADLQADVAGAVAAVEAIAPGVPVHSLSALTGVGLDVVTGYLGAGRTGVVLGPSGVGKSTIVNALLGQSVMATAEVRASDGRGRHTTVARQLLVLPQGGLLIDTPGIRSLELWDAEEGIDATFEDVEALAADCRFSDCAHRSEPGCAVRAAIDDGRLAAERFEGWDKLEREATRRARAADPRARAETRRFFRVVSAAADRAVRTKYSDDAQ